MSRILAIKGTDQAKEVDYSLLSEKDIQKRIKSYEKRYGSYPKFLKSYDCETGSPDDYLALIDWECLLNEIKGRKGAKLSLVRGGRKKPR